MSEIVLEFARACFHQLIKELLDNPSSLLHPWRSVEPLSEIANYRKLAADLGLDYDAMVRSGSVCAQKRLADIEHGLIQPVPRERIDTA